MSVNDLFSNTGPNEHSREEPSPPRGSGANQGSMAHDAEHSASAVGQHASPPMHAHHPAAAAAAAPLASETSPSAGGDRPAGSRSRASLSGSDSDSPAAREPNLPFTYSGVFSHHVWQGEDEAADGKPWQPAGGDGVRTDDADLMIQPHAGVRGSGAATLRSHCVASGLHTAQFPQGGDSDDLSSSEDDDDLGDSDSESYEGLAVDDVNETYDHKLPEYVPNPDPMTQRIYLDEEGIALDVRGMVYSALGLLVYRLVGVLSCGLVPLICRWVPRWRIQWTMKPVHLGEADFAVAVDEYGCVSVEPIQRLRYGGTLESVFGSLTRRGPLYKHSEDIVPSLAMFTHRYYRFVYHPCLEKFLPNVCWMDSAWTRSPMSIRSGLSTSVEGLRTALFGANNIDIEEKPINKLLFDEVLNPFYVFQVGSIILWSLDNYYYYAACILLISASGIIETLLETRRNTRKIKEMAHFTCPVRILRDGAWRDGSAEDLLPGDVFEVVSSMHTLPCDAVLLEGDCIVNESMLTGESIPVAKVPVAPVVFRKLRLASSTFGSDVAKHVLFSGTKLVRVKKTTLGFGGARWLDLEQRTGLGTPSRATAMVLRTGFNTTKGALVRSILFPRPNKFKFYEDSFRFIGVLACIAIIGFLASVGNFVRLGIPPTVILVRALDLITVVVPPALPATMSIGVSFALARLRRRQIYCISPTRINVCGKINVMCFDKTGTLTEEGLDVLGVQTMDYDACQFKELQEDPSVLLQISEAAPSAPSSAFSSVGSSYAMGLPGGLADLDRSASMTVSPKRVTDPSKLRVLHALATCHTVKQIDGEPIGDPLDIKMFQSTGWILEESDDYSALPSMGSPLVGSASVAEHAVPPAPNARGARPMMPVPAVVRPPTSERFTLDPAGNSNVYELGIIRTFDFSAALRRQSVIAKRLGARYNEVYVKGAPEAIRELCFSSTIPRDFDRTLLGYTNRGYRVIALAGKPLKMSWPKLQRLKRDAVEQDLVFMGFVVFENKLKPTTAPVLDELRGAKIRQIMCTGDNVLTAISVGRECGMVHEDMHVFVPRLVRRKECTPGPQLHPAPGGHGSRGSSGSSDGAYSSDTDVRAMIVWENVDDEASVLDPFTLEPRMATAPVKERLVTSDVSETSEEMDQQQQQYLTWLHNYTNVDMALTTSGKYCVAMTGEVFRYMMDESPATTVGRVLMRGAIYARMSPDEKAELVESLQTVGYCTGFCGDGANDCGALRAADVGLSLSEAEASVAAPFTSHSTDIQCVLEVIREGRAALVTSFSCFKFMALYSIIQFTSVSMLYKFGGGLGDFQFLYIDLFVIIPLAVSMGQTPAFGRIAPKRPTASLMSKKVLTSLFGQIAINSSIQVMFFRLVKHSAGYSPPKREDPTDLDLPLILSYENTALFLVSTFQYIIVAIVFSVGPPYRQSNLRNRGLVIACVLLVLSTAVLVLNPNDWALQVFQMVDLSPAFRRTIVVWAAFNFVLCALGEAWLFPRMAPTAARYGRITMYLARRYLFRSSHPQYTKLAASDLRSSTYAPPNKRRLNNRNAEIGGAGGSPSVTVGGPDHDASSMSLAYDLEGARREPTWEEIGQKPQAKPFKRILREMGIPACQWYPTIYVRLALRSATLADATHIQVLEHGQHRSLEHVDSSVADGRFEEGFGVSKEHSSAMGVATSAELRTVSYQHHAFVFAPLLGRYTPVSSWKDPQWSSGRTTDYAGLASTAVEQRRLLFGRCAIDIREKSYLRLIWEEALNPLYIFQLASIAIWCAEEYFYYAIAIFVISAVSIASTVVTTKSSAQKIREMAAYVCPVHVLRGGVWTEARSDSLVPGDIVDISAMDMEVLPCDAVLLEGDCIVNESMLTGEGVPESKVPLGPKDAVLEMVDMEAHAFHRDISRHLLFAGTKLIRTRKAASKFGAGCPSLHTTAMVFRTGFCTTKGTLVRAILFPRPTSFRFYRDAMYFICVLAGIAAIGLVVNTINLNRLGASKSEIGKRVLDIITIVVPPALPASMSIGMAFAVRRLRKEGIFCISPSRINVASKVAIMCFDKTGTLTEEGLDVLGVCAAGQDPGELAGIQSMPGLHKVPVAEAKSNKTPSSSDPSVTAALATCHSLHLVDGALVGDPLEVKMFEFTGWRMEEADDAAPGESLDLRESTVVYPPGTRDRNPASPSLCQGVELVQCFEFVPELRRSSVVTKSISMGGLQVYVKGAPEAIRELCLAGTIPGNFDQVLDTYTQRGYRVIAFAGKTLDISLGSALRLERGDAEHSLAFLCLLVLENRLKPTTTAVLQELHDAQIRTVMCTGDNPLTAIGVARECHLVDPAVHVFVSSLDTGAGANTLSMHHPVAWRESSGLDVVLDPVTLMPIPADPASLAAVKHAQNMSRTGAYCLAVTGDVFGYLAEEERDRSAWKRLLMRGAVYARMAPEQKGLLVSELQQLGYIAGFCGDGANDCAALKTADVGISLSEAEASVAAPFTSQMSGIECVAKLLKEGRCSIATSLSCFKYMVLYSMIQFTTCCFLYAYNVTLTDGQFLLIDLFMILPIAVCMGRFRPYERLAPKRPPSRLTGKRLLTPILGHIAITIVFQTAVFLMARTQSWYQDPRPETPNDPDSTPNKGWLNTNMFLFSLFQYLLMGAVFSIGPPYRQGAFSNVPFIATMSVLLAFDLWVVLIPVPGLRTLFSILDMPVGWRFVVAGMAVGNLAVCYLCERVVFPWVAVRLASAYYVCRRALCRGPQATLDSTHGGVHGPLIANDAEPRMLEMARPTSTEDAKVQPRLSLRPDRKEYKVLQQDMADALHQHSQNMSPCR
ncbi:hypothetical protein GGF46_000511 [Coemansia sp. RSA 552]|nr:hypothetical protein GGF46_000511 [Coemansia sp. RSA 552]